MELNGGARRWHISRQQRGARWCVEGNAARIGAIRAECRVGRGSDVEDGCGQPQRHTEGRMERGDDAEDGGVAEVAHSGQEHACFGMGCPSIRMLGAYYYRNG